MQTHHLKLDKYYWDAVKSGEKSFEVRRDDRGLQKGDRLCLHKYDCSDDNGGHSSYYEGRYIQTIGDYETRTKEEYESDKMFAEITYILTGGQHGIEPGYVVLGIKLLKEHNDGNN
ncbi:DUF3850 domain-containing protein [Synergistes jonesii]|uniref:DUF3850 domain-containing protein n=1 Tax=Synergistes jonesii TaxID=2754 RepID=A0A073J1X6_9BACT|nr:DUF3850 domain-containing protein [Synergistes jonesii]KEJ91707.1 hypothetical protein EH55_06950 [Synergistes jonesii]OFB61782.1 hypothetical protein JS73_09065 [Synergistes jonesii]OFB64126.1 hypothetical protein JS72_05400 [Synergistes jonesii]OFB67283.1 hypothetical protein JS78_09075 [Synergistes jonesii]OFB69184.1 hypothetical protein JS77_09085 [Synergistes jonesii]